MTRENIENTLLNMRKVKSNVELEGLTVDKCILGAELLKTFESYSNYIVINSVHKDRFKMIFGIPIIIDFNNPYKLELVTVHKVEVEGVR